MTSGPAPVAITSVDPTVDPMPVSVVSGKPDMTAPQQAESNRGTLGQRRINLLWEVTQAILSIVLVSSAIAAALWLIVNSPSDRTAAFLSLTTMAGLVIGTYYSRTNHQRTGGVGPDEIGR